MDNTENSKYEIMVILLPDLGEEGSKKELDEIRSLITENGGEIYHEDVWGIRDFAYKMKKQEQGFYTVFNFTLEPEKVRKLEKPLRLNQKLIRYLIVKTPENYEIKTLEEYLKEAEIEEQQKQNEQKQSSQPSGTRRVGTAKAPKAKKPEAVKEDKKEVKEEPKKEEPKKEEPKKEEPKKEEPKKEEPKKEEPKEEPKEEEPKKEEKKPTVKLDDIDERLRSIIDDPDISL